MSFWKGKNVLITGGGGFIGSNLAQDLAGFSNVTITVRRGSGLAGNRLVKELEGMVQVLEADLLEMADCRKACQGKDYVFHLAAVIGGAEYIKAHPASILRDNTCMTMNVLEAARASGVKRMMLASSSNVYAENARQPLVESEGFSGEPGRTRFGYAWSKRFAEVLARSFASEFGMKIGIARPFSVYGRGMPLEYEMASIIPRIILNLHKGRPVRLFGDGTQKRSFIYVSDVVECMKLIMEKHPEPDPINIGSRDEIALCTLARRIAALMGKEPRIELTGADKEGGRRGCDIRKAEVLLGFSPKVGLEEGLQRTIGWFNENA